MTDIKHHQVIHDLSEKIVAAISPLKILDALKWDNSIEEAFFKSKCKELPNVQGPEFYAQNPLGFDPDNKIAELKQIEKDIHLNVGQSTSVGTIMQRICRESCIAVEMLKARGTPHFGHYAKQIYGSTQDSCYAGSPTLNDMAVLISNTVPFIQKQNDLESNTKNYTSEQASKMLDDRLATYFKDEQEKTFVSLSDNLSADAATDSKGIKLRKDAMFSECDLNFLEVHEGWVHLGTTLNARRQPICTFLSKESPSSPLTQEGLAVFMEIFSFSSHPARIKSLSDRVLAINMAENGGNFLDVFNFFQKQGHSDTESYKRAVRVFRGSTVEGAPFTKDLAYNKGFVQIYNHIRVAIQKGLLAHIPLLFLGKTTLGDLPMLHDLVEEGIVIPPKYLPPQFKNLAALSSFMCYSLFLNQLEHKNLNQEYEVVY